jgi:hypothetical protein
MANGINRSHRRGVDIPQRADLFFEMPPRWD